MHTGSPVPLDPAKAKQMKLQYIDLFQISQHLHTEN